MPSTDDAVTSRATAPRAATFGAGTFRAATCRSPTLASTAAVTDLLGLLIPGHPLPHPRAKPPLRRLRGCLDRLAERLQLSRRVEPKRTARVELIRLQLRSDVPPQAAQVARDRLVPTPIRRGEPRVPPHVDRGPPVGAFPSSIGRGREGVRREEDQGVEQVLVVDLHDLELRQEELGERQRRP